MPFNEIKDYHKDQSLALDAMQELLEDGIANFAITKQEDIYHEEHDEVMRAITFERGNKSFYVVIDMYGRIPALQKELPKELMLQIHNIFISDYADSEIARNA